MTKLGKRVSTIKRELENLSKEELLRKIENQQKRLSEQNVAVERGNEYKLTLYQLIKMLGIILSEPFNSKAVSKSELQSIVDEGKSLLYGKSKKECNFEGGLSKATRTSEDYRLRDRVIKQLQINQSNKQETYKDYKKSQNQSR